MEIFGILTLYKAVWLPINRTLYSPVKISYNYETFWNIGENLIK